MRIFLDANVIISAIIFPESKTAYVLSYILECHEPVICTFTIKECFKVFEKKFPQKIESLEEFFNNIDYYSFETPDFISSSDYPKIRDPNDLPVLASAILSDSDIILTGDKDFEDLKMNRPLVITPSKYYDLI